MASKIGLGQRFHWGLNIDDVWTHTGLTGPKSIVIPYLLSMRMRGGLFTLPEDPEGTNNRDPGRLAGVLASFLKKNGVEFVRCWFQWNFFEQPTRVVRHGPSLSTLRTFSSSNRQFPLDDFVSKMNEAGIEIIGVIGNGYHRFLPAGVQTDRLDEYLKRLVDSSTKIVRHYKDKVKVWQIENEPNWWKAHYYIQWRRGLIWLTGRSREPILSALHDVVRSECPGATIIINLEAEERVSDWKGFAKYSDILGVDTYPNYFPRTKVHPSKLATIALQVRRETGLPIFVIETGYPTGPSVLGYDEKKQVQYIKTACETAFTCDAITGLGWFRFSDSYWRSFPPQENHFGLFTREGRPKPGWTEYVNQIRQRR